jgi:segregation and condensation protein A
MLKLLPDPVVLPVFEGPLDLLLRLIERNQLDITEVSLALVTDQYLGYLAALREPDPDTLASFLVVAAKLVLIKSRALLPHQPSEELEDDVGEDLAAQLMEYIKVKEAASFLSERQRAGLTSYPRMIPEQENRITVKTRPHQISELVLAVQTRIREIQAEPRPEALPERIVTVPERASQLIDILARERQMSFGQLLGDLSCRQEVIVTFLAVLELLRRREIDVHQGSIFGTIVISYLSAQHQREQ